MREASNTASGRDEGCDVAPITNWAGLYVGIDFDTHAVHLVKLSEDGAATYTRCELVGLDAFERTRHVRQAMPGASYWDDVVAVGIEEPQGVQKATVSKLKAVQGAILACIPRATLVEPMVPARWRKVADLPGGASKEYVNLHVRSRITSRGNTAMNLIDWPQDACDAYCLALAVSRLVEEAA